MSKSQDVEASLEAQIGGLGGAPQEETQSLGKLKHKESYGQRADLTDDEQKELDDFLTRGKVRNAKRMAALTQEETISDEQPAIGGGWVPIDREEMGIRSIFYPESWQFYIRPATVQAIKNWTAIDEERPDIVNNVFNDMMRSCIKISTGSDLAQANWMSINSWDRFWFVLKIRQYTYSIGEAEIAFTDNCSECDELIKYTLNADALHYEFPDEELIEKYWDGNAWEINPIEYNIEHDPITLYTPKLGKDEAIIQWATAKAQAKQKLDENFIKFVVWMINKPSKDPQMLDRQIQKAYEEYKSWDLDMFDFMLDVINNITINQSETLKVVCPSCGQEAISTVQFPDGIKALFANTSKKAKKFGSR